MRNSRSMVVGMIVGSLLTLVGLAVLPSLLDQPAQAKPHRVKGENYPSGRIPQEIINGEYPRSYFPGTEIVGQDEMRVTAVGTGMPTQTPTNAAACFLVELGNGESFLFDLGVGATDRLSGLELDYAKLDKVFVSHLHTDHCGDIAPLWVAGWLGGRYMPLQVYGPSGSEPALGITAHIDHIRAAWAWDVTSRTSTWSFVRLITVMSAAMARGPS